jgi:hypothetical protein
MGENEIQKKPAESAEGTREPAEGRPRAFDAAFARHDGSPVVEPLKVDTSPSFLQRADITPQSVDKQIASMAPEDIAAMIEANDQIHIPAAMATVASLQTRLSDAKETQTRFG